MVRSWPWVLVVLGLVFTAACRPEPSPQSQAYSDCMRNSMGDWADQKISDIPDAVYSRAIRRCDHLDPHYYQDEDEGA